MSSGKTSLNTAGEDFQSHAETAAPGVLMEMVDFLIHNKKWWLTPIFTILLLVGCIIVLSGSSVGPFIYALF